MSGRVIGAGIIIKEIDVPYEIISTVCFMALQLLTG